MVSRIVPKVNRFFRSIPDNIKEILAKYSIRESRVVLPDIRLNKSIKIVNNTAKLPSDGKHTCSICKKKFLTEKDRNKHKRTHEDEEENVPEKRRRTTPGTKQTKNTPKGNSAKNTIKNYFHKSEKVNSTIVAHKCDTCNMSFTSVEKIKKHPPNKCRFVCGVCSKSYNTIYAFTVHVLQHKINVTKPAPPEKLHKCTLCSESFDDYIDLKTHGIVVHKVKTGSANGQKSKSDEQGENNNEKTEIICELCFDIFATEDELEEHMEFHKQIDDEPDDKVAEESSADVPDDDVSADASDDSSSDTPLKPNVVSKCETSSEDVELPPIPVIESSYSLADQEPGTSPTKTDDEKGTAPNPGYDILPPNEAIPKKHYKCKKCDRVYISITEFDGHLKKACKIENVCTICLTTMSKNSEWYAHMTEQHQRWATCKFCFQTFTELKELDKHRLQKHFSSFKNVCKICFKGFLTYQEFNDHLRKEHLNL